MGDTEAEGVVAASETVEVLGVEAEAAVALEVEVVAVTGEVSEAVAAAETAVDLVAEEEVAAVEEATMTRDLLRKSLSLASLATHVKTT